MGYYLLLFGELKYSPHNSHYITLKVIWKRRGFWQGRYIFPAFVGFARFFVVLTRPGLEVALTRPGVEFSGFRLRKSAEKARMSNWDGSCYRNHGERINGLFHLINGVCRWCLRVVSCIIHHHFSPPFGEYVVWFLVFLGILIPLIRSRNRPGTSKFPLRWALKVMLSNTRWAPYQL